MAIQADRRRLHELRVAARGHERLNHAPRERGTEEAVVEAEALAEEIGHEIKKLSANSLYVEGTSNILALPDFSKTEEIQDFFKLIEEKEMLAKVFEKELAAETFSSEPHLKGRKQVQVRIGSDHIKVVT